MIAIVRLLLVAVFASVIFFRPYFPNDFLYWCMYLVLFGLVCAFWYVSFWVSKKKAAQILGKEPEQDVFCGRVPESETADLERGRLCVTDGKLVLVAKNQYGRYETPVTVKIADITSVGFGYVVGKRKGFTIHMGNKAVSFTSAKIAKDKSILYNMLGWSVPEDEK